MADREPPGIDWARVYVEAVNLAAEITKRDAQDVANDAVALYLAGQAPYDPAEGKRSRSTWSISVSRPGPKGGAPNAGARSEA